MPLGSVLAPVTLEHCGHRLPGSNIAQRADNTNGWVTPHIIYKAVEPAFRYLSVAVKQNAERRGTRSQPRVGG